MLRHWRIPTAAAAAALAVTAVQAAGTETAAPPPVTPVDPAAETIYERVGIDPAANEAATTTPSGEQISVARDADTVCVSDETGGGHCAPRALLAEGYGFGGELCVDGLPADKVRITGAVPSDVTSVAIDVDGEPLGTASPADGVVAFEVARTQAQGTLHVVMASPTGTRTADVPAPPLAADAACGGGG